MSLHRRLSAAYRPLLVNSSHMEGKLNRHRKVHHPILRWRGRIGITGKAAAKLCSALLSCAIKAPAYRSLVKKKGGGYLGLHIISSEVVQ